MSDPDLAAMAELRRLQSASTDAWTEMMRGAEASMKSMKEAFDRAGTCRHFVVLPRDPKQPPPIDGAITLEAFVTGHGAGTGRGLPADPRTDVVVGPDDRRVLGDAADA